jgi:membrane glycosyltransferase
MAPSPEPLEWRVFALRSALLTASVLTGCGGFVLFMRFGAADGLDAMDIIRATLILLSTFWLAWGASQALAGLTTRPAAPTPAAPTARLRHDGPLTSRCVILVPIYNEDPADTFPRIAAIDTSLRQTGFGPSFDIAILSDTTDPDIATAEHSAFQRLLALTDGTGRIFFRRRATNTGRKAGNIADFITQSGAAYDLAVILDADSLMEGTTLVEMARRMEADPTLGLLQTLPRIVNARSRFGRIQQFAAALYAPVFCRGQAMMQGRTGPFWGHNAIIRMRAFAESCGLPELSGPPPFGGHILSHDYVEAALLARAGWGVRVDDDLMGSYEQGPENMVLHARRDRRWCQGNLQHSRLLTAPGLTPWSRFVFVSGILAYLAPVIWLAFLLCSITAPLFAPPIDYFPVEGWRWPVIPVSQTSKAILLAICILALLFLPKILILTDAALRNRTAGFGGRMATARAVGAELLFSALTAPVFMMFNTRSVLQVITGRDGGWPAQARGDGALSLPAAWAASRWIVASGLTVSALSAWLAPHLLAWLAPVILPMLAAPALIAWSSAPSQGALFQTPMETTLPDIVRQEHHFRALWQAPPIASRTTAA